MKLSNKVTAHLLVKAYTNSEWDNCEFAIIHLTEEWKCEQAKRLEQVMSLQRDHRFMSVHFYDTAVDFYVVCGDGGSGIEDLREEQEWAFVELESQDQDSFVVPESRLDRYNLVFRADGTAYHKAYGTHTGEEFWTGEFHLHTICRTVAGETEIETFCRERFRHLTNVQLVARVNSLPDFKWDDEGVELQRRARISNGAFNYGIKGNTMIILRDEML